MPLGLMGEIAALQGRRDLARTHFAAALAEDPDALRVRMMLADVLLADGDAAAALEAAGRRAGGGRRAAAPRHRRGAPRPDARSSTPARAELSRRFRQNLDLGLTAHAREEARYYLEVDPDPALALSRAQVNWSLQREIEDAQLLIDAAVAADAPAAAAPVLRWMAEQEVVGADAAHPGRRARGRAMTWRSRSRVAARWPSRARRAAGRRRRTRPRAPIVTLEREGPERRGAAAGRVPRHRGRRPGWTRISTAASPGARRGGASTRSRPTCAPASRSQAGGACDLRGPGRTPRPAAGSPISTCGSRGGAPSAEAPLTARSRLFTEIDPDHRMFLQASIGGRTTSTMLSAAEPSVELDGDTGGIAGVVPRLLPRRRRAPDGRTRPPGVPAGADAARGLRRGGAPAGRRWGCWRR